MATRGPDHGADPRAGDPDRGGRRSAGVHPDLRIALCYGGTSWDKQAKVVEQGTDIVVGTPGRLIDYYRKGVLKLHRIEVFILDEADRMFDMGFIGTFSTCSVDPEQEQASGALFSAT